MRIVEFAEMVRESNEKINRCRDDMHESHNPIYNDSLLIEIQALEWVQGQIQDLVNNRVRNEKMGQRNRRSFNVCPA
jgi:hypothetical protein